MGEPSRPPVTWPQIIGVLIAGIPTVANLLQAFGVYTVTTVEQVALTRAVEWASVFGSVLVAADAVLRAARNHAHAKVATTLAWRQPPPPLTPTNPPLPPEPKPKPARKRPAAKKKVEK